MEFSSSSGQANKTYLFKLFIIINQTKTIKTLLNAHTSLKKSVGLNQEAQEQVVTFRYYHFLLYESADKNFNVREVHIESEVIQKVNSSYRDKLCT